MNLQRLHFMLLTLVAFPLCSQPVNSTDPQSFVYSTQIIKEMDIPVLVPKGWLFGVYVPEPEAQNSQISRLDVYISSGPPRILNPVVRQVDPYSVVISKFISKHGSIPTGTVSIHPVFIENKVQAKQIIIDNHTYEIYGPSESKRFNQWVYQVIISTPSHGTLFEVFTSTSDGNEAIRQQLKFIADSFRPQSK